MIDDFLLRAAFGGIGIALVTAPLGCFVVWQRMAYFGETIAHSGLLGVALGLILGINLIVGVFIAAVVVALGLSQLEQRTFLGRDAALGLMAHIVLALGLIIASKFSTQQFDLMGYLFGDILAITLEDLAIIYGVGAVILLILSLFWQRLLVLSVDKEIAIAEGVNGRWVQLMFSLLIAATIAIAMKLVGLLLVTAMLIIPPASAMKLAATPEQMALYTAIISSFAVIMGLALSFYGDTPTGPSIVVSMGVMFLITPLFARRS